MGGVKTMNLNSIKYFSFAFCLFFFGGQYLFSLENANHGNMKIICPDNDFEKPVSNPIFHIEIYEHDVFLQTIEYSYQDTFMLEKHFDLLDVNFDGHDDIVILAGLTANGGQKYYDAYIWNLRQNKFILHDEIRNVIKREKQHNSAGARGGDTADGNSSAAEEDLQEEEKNPAITNPHWENADGQDDDVATLTTTVNG